MKRSSPDVPAPRPSGTVPLLEGPGAPRVPHLIVVEASSSFPFPLPMPGTVVIGRGDEADLSLNESATSRRHAELSLEGGQVRILDLGSRNGTQVNGERLESERWLLPGDSITIGATTLILYMPQAPGAAAAAAARQRTDLRGLQRRLQEELERGRLFDRTVGVVVILIDGGGPSADPQEQVQMQVQMRVQMIDRRVDTELRFIDVGAWLTPRELALVLPEVDLAQAGEIAGRLAERLRLVGVTARVGFAAYPSSACEPDALLGAARAAARAAAGGEAVASDQAARVEIGDETMIVADPAMVKLVDLVRRLAPTDLPVLIHGETGVGKEKAAHALHQWSRRQRGPFVAVNCAAFTESLIESELFGAERGAYSGAVAARPGLLEAAAGGTIFFDEIGELPRALQPKLLRVLESKRALRVGGTQERELDIRVVAATNRDLGEEVKQGRFRQDLLFRLNAATVVLPPLRNRPGEIASLARTFLTEACARLDVGSKTLAGASLHLLTRYLWPGNVRELKNVIDFLAATVPGATIDPDAVRDRLATVETQAPLTPVADAATTAAPFPAGPAAETTGAATVTLAPEKGDKSEKRNTRGYATTGAGTARFSPIADEIRRLEQRRIEEALEATGGVQTRAAELIGMPLRTFQQKVKQLGLTRHSSTS